jgi:CrcB protein
VSGHPPRSSSVDARVLAAVFCGGILGALARTALEEALPHAADAWPWATFAVNVVGAFVLGFAVTRILAQPEPSLYRRAFVASGVCGALTTFSTLQLELLRMIDGSEWALAFGYAAASLLAGLGAVALATGLARRRGIAA